MAEALPRICDKDGQGLIFPLGDAERNANNWLRGTLYLVGLGYMFMGVNIVADYFMSAVEKIVSAKVRIYDKMTGRTVTLLRWNDTVANLSLLALGSSAPEILLSCVEMVGNKFHSGALGPSTIVGSAAFNLLVIISVCVYSIPKDEIRAIKEMPAYHVTVLFSIFAYLWLLAIVQWITPEVVDIWEAVVTLLMFPTLIYVSFKADTGYLDFMALEKPPVEEEEQKQEIAPAQGRSSGRRVSAFALDATPGPRASSTDTTGGFHKKMHPRARRSQAHREQVEAGIASGGRASARRASTTAPKEKFTDLTTVGEELSSPVMGTTCVGEVDGKITDPVTKQEIDNENGVICFAEDNIEVDGIAESRDQQIAIYRKNGTRGKVTFMFRTAGLNAVPDHDFEASQQKVVFQENEEIQFVCVTIKPKRPGEPRDMFQIILENIQGGAKFNPNDDGGSEHGILTVTILNKNPQDARTCGEKLEAFIDYDSLRHGISLWQDQIKGAFSLDDDDDNDNAGDGDADGEDAAKDGGGKVADKKSGESNKDEDDGGHSVIDWVFFVIQLPWNFIFAVLAPPANWGGGWCLFTLSLLYIAVLIAVVWDLASLFGCCVGLSDEVTAITFVALGTSLPDMLASRTSAQNDDTADASIVNVTGSNSVNVFLGIGIPWSICAAYWSVVGDTAEWRRGVPEALHHHAGKFVVKAGALSFSVLVFSCVAVVALMILRIRRLTYGGELGGPGLPKTVSSCALLSLWAIYIAASIWRAESEDAEVLAIPLGIMAFISVVFGVVRECFLRKENQIVKPQVVSSSSSNTHGERHYSSLHSHREQHSPKATESGEKNAVTGVGSLVSSEAPPTEEKADPSQDKQVAPPPVEKVEKKLNEANLKAQHQDPTQNTFLSDDEDEDEIERNSFKAVNMPSPAPKQEKEQKAMNTKLADSDMLSAKKPVPKKSKKPVKPDGSKQKEDVPPETIGKAADNNPAAKKTVKKKQTKHMEDVAKDVKDLDHDDQPEAERGPSEVEAWLIELGLQEYYSDFQKHGYDSFQILRNVEKEEMTEFMVIAKVKRGHIRALQRGLEDLKVRPQGGSQNTFYVAKSSQNSSQEDTAEVEKGDQDEADQAEAPEVTS